MGCERDGRIFRHGDSQNCYPLNWFVASKYEAVVTLADALFVHLNTYVAL